MMRPAILLSVRREYSRRARLLIALLALIQVIAPTWHVCEMGGHSCCPAQSSTSSSLQHCARVSTELVSTAVLTSTPARRHCNACPRTAATAQLKATPSPFGENCLAKLLLGMPGQFASAPTQETTFITRRTYVVREYFYFDSFATKLPPSRAPPRFS